MIVIADLVGILSSIKKAVNEGTLRELEKGQEPLSYVRMDRSQLEKEFVSFTLAIIKTISENSFSPLKA